MPFNKKIMPRLFQSKHSLNMTLLGVVLGLGLFAWLIPPEDRLREHDNRAKMSDISPEQISSIEIRITNKAETRLKKRAGRWFMTAPIHIEANDFLANKVTKLLNSEYSSTFFSEQAQWVKYGLSPAWISLQLDKQHIDLGHSNQITRQRYALYKNTIFLIPDNIPTLLNAAPSGFISTKIVPSGSQIIAVELVDFSVIQQDGKWHLRFKNGDGSAAISQDRYVEFIDEWRLAQAIYVRLEPTSATVKSVASLPIVVKLADGQMISYDIVDEDTGKQFIRPELGIYYHLHKDAAQALLNFPESAK